MSDDIQFRRVDSNNADVLDTFSTPPPSSRSFTERVLFSYLTRLLLLLGLCAFIGIGLPLVWSRIWSPKTDRGIESDLRYECLPLRTEEPSKLRNTSCFIDRPSSPCQWDQTSAELQNEIACYYEVEFEGDLRSDNFPGLFFGKIPRYQVISNDADDRKSQLGQLSQGPNGSISGLEHLPELNDPNLHYLRMAVPPPFLDPKNRNLNHAPIVHQLLTVQVTYYSPNHLRVLIKPYDEPDNLWSRHFNYNYPTHPNGTSESSNATVTITPTSGAIRRDIFQLQVTRNSTGAALFNMGLHTPFIFSKGYIEFSTMLPNEYVYGLGQSAGQTFRHNFSSPRTWNLFAQYPNPHLKENQTENVTTMWGSHPFYLGVDDPKSGEAYGVLLLNSFPIQVTSNARPSLSFKTFGGHLELHFFLGPRPADVLRQLQSFIYKPFFPPYWALGFHACTTTCSIPSMSPSLESELAAYQIPVESDCSTALRHIKPPIPPPAGEYPEKENFKKFKDQVNSRHRKYLSVETPHRPTQEPKERENYWRLYSLLETSGSSSRAYEGYTYQCNDENRRIENAIYYPDFFNPKLESFYESSNGFHDFADGYFLDYNTPLNLFNLNGSLICQEMARRLHWNKWNFGLLNEMGPCLDVDFSKGSVVDLLPEKEKEAGFGLAKYMAFHNMYGFKQAEMVHRIASKRSTSRPLVLSLSTFLGIGRFAGHIGAPIYSNWTSLRMVLKQTLDFSLFGVPLSGFPVGGYKGDIPNDEVLRRWYQLASVQPFMITYTDFNAPSRSKLANVQDMKMIRSNVQARYKLLPYMYTLFMKASSTGSLVVAPLFIEFFDDSEVYKINNQFMLGPALLVSPVVDEGVTLVKAYFPTGNWYEYYSGHLVSKKEGEHLEISAVEQNVNLHIRGGYMVPNHYRTELTIEETRQKHGFQIIAALDEHHHATGDLYIDDGISHPVTSYLNIKFDFTYSNITIIVADTKEFCRRKIPFGINTQLASVKLYGIIEKPHNAEVKVLQGKSEAELPEKGKSLSEPQVKFQNNFGVLSIEPGVDFCDQPVIRLEWSYENFGDV